MDAQGKGSCLVMCMNGVMLSVWSSGLACVVERGTKLMRCNAMAIAINIPNRLWLYLLAEISSMIVSTHNVILYRWGSVEESITNSVYRMAMFPHHNIWVTSLRYLYLVKKAKSDIIRETTPMPMNGPYCLRSHWGCS